MTFASNLRSTLFLVVSLIYGGSPGQVEDSNNTATLAPTTATRLQNTESTFEAGLKKVQHPILRDYLQKLEALQQLLRSQSRPISAVQNEIETIQKILQNSETYPLNLHDLADSLLLNGNTQQGIFIFIPSNIVRTVNNLQHGNAPLALGQAQWLAQAIENGRYLVQMVYSAPNLKTDVPLHLNCGRADLKVTLHRSLGSSNENDFKIFELGYLDFGTQEVGEHISLNAKAPAHSPIYLSHLILSPAPAILEAEDDATNADSSNGTR